MTTTTWITRSGGYKKDAHESSGKAMHSTTIEQEINQRAKRLGIAQYTQEVQSVTVEKYK
jgi:hypothetical protein